MKKIALILVLVVIAVLILVPPSRSTTSTLTGTIKDAQGNPVNGTLVMQLPVPAQDTTTNTAVAASPVTFRIVNGVITGGAPLYDVATLQPQNLYYSARVYDSAGTLIFTGNYVVTGASYNLGAATPTNVTTSNVSYVSPAATNQSNVFCCTQTFQGQIVDTLPTGTAPLSVSSTTLVTNLNAGGWGSVFVSGAPVAGQVPTATGATTATWQSPSAGGGTQIYPNSVTGTVAGLLAKLTGAPSTVVTVGLTDTAGSVGICLSGCGTTGSATIAASGQASCTFDGATTAGDYVQISNTTQGNCHDAGAAYPGSGQVLGRILSTNGGSGTYTITLFGPEIKNGTESLMTWGAATVSFANGNPVCPSSAFAYCPQWIFVSAHTLLRLNYVLSVSPSGCTTAAQVGLKDITSSTTLASMTVANGQALGLADSGPLSVSMTAGHTFALGLVTSPVGCSAPTVMNLTAVYQ